MRVSLMYLQWVKKTTHCSTRLNPWVPWLLHLQSLTPLSFPFLPAPYVRVDVGNPAKCLSFPVTFYIGHEKLQPPGFHLSCNWFFKKKAILADFFQKDKKRSWNNWHGKGTHKQVWQDYKSTLPVLLPLWGLWYYEVCSVQLCKTCNVQRGYTVMCVTIYCWCWFLLFVLLTSSALCFKMESNTIHKNSIFTCPK